MTQRQLQRSIVVVFVLLATLFGVGTKVATTRQGAVLGQRTSTRSTLPPPPAAGAIERVARVVDGDTFVLENGWKVRYIGINAPEIAHPGKAGQCFGDEATQRDQQLVEGKEVRLEKDVSQTDQFGRLLRYVYVDNQLINDELVREGFARAKAFPPDTAFRVQFEASQQQAQAEKRGLWQKCAS